MVTVIVNQGGSAGSSSSGGASSGSSGGASSQPEPSSDPIIQQINDAQGDFVNLNQSDVPVITSPMLDALRRTGKSMSVTGEGYILTVNGADIRNTQNGPTTPAPSPPPPDEAGVVFPLTGAPPLPSPPPRPPPGNTPQYPRLYLYNEATGQWQYLNSYADSVVTTDTAGRYLLTNDTLTFIHMNIYALAAAGVVLVAIVVVYIAVKKRYWFW